MTKQQFLEHALITYGTSPDYPFDDNLETAVLRHPNKLPFRGFFSVDKENRN